MNLNQTLQEKYPHLEVSVLKLSEVKKNIDFRIDDSFWTMKLIYNNKLNYKKIGECLLKSQYGISINMNEGGDGIPIYRMNDIDNMLCNFEVKKYALIDKNELQTFRLNYGDVLFNRTNSYEFVGRTGIFYNNRENFVFASYLVRLVCNKEILLPEYLTVFLNTHIGKKEIRRRARPSINQTNVNPEELKEIKIPIFPMEFQLEIQMQSLLDSKTNNPTKSLNISIHTLKESFLKTGRLDSEYYQKKYEINEKIIMNKKYTVLDNLVSITKSIEPGSNLYKNKGIPFIRVANLTQYGLSEGDVFLDEKDFFPQYLQILYPKKDTILFSKDGSVGIAYCVKEDKEVITSGAILHLNIKDKENILPEYLTLFLNSIFVKLQAQRDCGGSIISHWRIEDIKKVLVAILDIKIQEKIAKYIQESFNLRKKSKQLLDNAKNKVEEQIQGKI